MMGSTTGISRVTLEYSVDILGISVEYFWYLFCIFGIPYLSRLYGTSRATLRPFVMSINMRVF